jgi:hypothetical protein
MSYQNVFTRAAKLMKSDRASLDFCRSVFLLVPQKPQFVDTWKRFMHTAASMGSQEELFFNDPRMRTIPQT